MLSIPHTLQAQARIAAEKGDALRTPGRLLISSMLAGAYIGVGIVLMISTAGPLAATGDGFTRLISGLVFGTALTLVVFAGADLATSAMMVLPQGILMRSIGVGRATATLLFICVANLLGALLFSALVAAAGLVQTNAAAGAMLSEMLAVRAAQSPAELLIRGILCNALVCLAIWMGMRVTSEVARILLIFIAITAFIASGFEHVIANMTTYGLGLFLAAPNATIALFGGNLLWVGIGNLIGGGLVIGIGYWVIGGRPRVTESVAENATLSA